MGKLTLVLLRIVQTEISYVIIEELDSESEEKNWTISDERRLFNNNRKYNSNLYFKELDLKTF